MTPSRHRRLMRYRPAHAPPAARAHRPTFYDAANESLRVAGLGRRRTMTGMALCVSTLRVSLPSKIADIPRCPCEAMEITKLVDQRKHFVSNEELREYISGRFNIPLANVDLIAE